MHRHDPPDDLSRRQALTALLGAAVAIGCGGSTTLSGSDSGAAGTSGDAGPGGTGDAATGDASSSDASTSSDASPCEVTPEGEIGPYFADDSDPRFQRTNISTNIDGTNPQTGIPLTLVVTVVDTEKSCAPYAAAQVDIWHCNAAGVYSDQAAENTTSETYLRGYQITDAAGTVTFQTVVPGWYAGRTTHIHLRVRSSYSSASSTSDGTNTTQLFFDQTLVDTLSTTVAPYSAEGKNPTTNAGDHVYTGEVSGANLLALTGDATAGFTASVVIRLPITSEGSGVMGGP